MKVRIMFFNRKKCCSLILGDIALNSSKIQTQKHDKKFDLKSRAQQRYMLFFSCRWMNSYRKKRRSPNNTMWWNIKWDPFPMNTTISWSSRALFISNLVFYVKKCYEYVGLCHFIFPPYLNKEIWRFSVSPHKTFTFLPLNYFHFFTPHCEIRQLEESPQKK